MAVKPENKFIGRVNRLLPLKKVKSSIRACQTHPVEQHIHYEKMNNPYSSGTADGWYSGLKGDLWVEYKYLPTMPVTRTVCPLKLLSPLQATWLKDRYKEGRNVAVVIGCPQGGVVLCERLWERDLTSEEFANSILSVSEIALWVLGHTAITTR